MITLTRVKQATSEFIKVLRMGKSDIQTAESVLPFGIDSKPVKDTLAVHAPTNSKETSVILGYIIDSSNTNEGEIRIYATDSSGAEVFSIYLKNDGTCEFGGTGDFFMRFLNTKDVIDEIQSDITSLKQVFSTWVPVPTDGGAALKAAIATWFATPLTENIDNSKIEEIKTA